MYFCHFNPLFSSRALMLELLSLEKMVLGRALALSLNLSFLSPFLWEVSRISWAPLSFIVDMWCKFKIWSKDRSPNCKDPLKRNLMILPMMALLLWWRMSNTPVLMARSKYFAWQSKRKVRTPRHQNVLVGSYFPITKFNRHYTSSTSESLSSKLWSSISEIKYFHKFIWSIILIFK